MHSFNLISGDITKFKGDAIVNAANQQLKGGGGVDGAIHAAAGPEVLRECREWIANNGKLPTGEAVITSSGRLEAKHIIHTPGPVWNGGTHNEDQLLSNCYINSLKLLLEKDLRSVAFPNISTGVYGFPKTEAADIAVSTVENYLSSINTPLEVSFYCFDEENYEIYKKLLPDNNSTG